MQLFRKTLRLDTKVWFEVRHSRLHLALVKPLPAWLLRLATGVGFGISFVPEAEFIDANAFSPNSAQFDTQVQLDRILASTPRLKSLEVRSRLNMDYGGLRDHTKLKSFYSLGGFSVATDWSSLKRLVMVGAISESISLIQGLGKLSRLEILHVAFPRHSWMNDLPQSLTTIYTRGRSALSYPFEHFGNLRRVGFSDVHVFDVAELSPNLSVETLDLANIRRLDNVPELILRYPNLKYVNYSAVGNSVFDPLRESAPHLVITDYDA
jgi:hypothetical protein